MEWFDMGDLYDKAWTVSLCVQNLNDKFHQTFCLQNFRCFEFHL